MTFSTSPSAKSPCRWPPDAIWRCWSRRRCATIFCNCAASTARAISSNDKPVFSGSKNMQLILISGLSGSGKSVALKILEDSGFYCVDNLPSTLLPQLVENINAYNYQRVAISVDTRSAPMLSLFPTAVHQLRKLNIDLRLLFLEAKTETLIKRFSETRRRHPLSEEGLTVPECIEKEREMLASIHGLSQRIDTSELTANQLRGWIRQLVQADNSRLTLIVQSFG